MFRFQADLNRYAQLIRKTLLRTPPDPTSMRLRDIRELLFLAKEFWSLGEKELYEYVRFFTMSAAEFLEDYFEDELVKAAMASPGIIGTALGVYSPGSAYILLHHVMGDVDAALKAYDVALTTKLEGREKRQVIANKADRQSVLLTTITWNGAVDVLTLKLDKTYWPTYEIIYRDNEWQRIAFR